MHRALASAFALVLASIPGVALAQAAAANEVAAPWSAVVDGLRARLIVAPARDADGHAQVAIDVEVENVSATQPTIDVFCGDLAHALTFELVDDGGQTLPRLFPGGNELARPPSWHHLARGAAVRVRVTPGGYEYSAGGRAWLRPLAFQAWDLTPRPVGRLHLGATLAPPAPDHPSPHAWRGHTLTLARVALP